MPAALAAQRRPGAEGRAHAPDDQGRSRSTSSASASGPSARSDIAPLVRGATGYRVLLAHDPRRLAEAAALEDPARALRPHARRTGRAAGHRRHRRTEVSGPRRHRHGATRRRCSSAAASERSTCRCESTARRKSRCSRSIASTSSRPTDETAARRCARARPSPDEPPAVDRPSAVQHESDRLRIDPVLLDRGFAPTSVSTVSSSSTGTAD